MNLMPESSQEPPGGRHSAPQGQGSPSLHFSTSLASYFTKLEVLDFAAAEHVAQRMPCARRLSNALQHVCTCEALYFSMAQLSQRAALEKFDRTARELEACLTLQAPLTLPSAQNFFWKKGSSTSAAALPMDGHQLARSSETHGSSPLGAEGAEAREAALLAVQPPGGLQLFGRLLTNIVACRPPAEWLHPLPHAFPTSPDHGRDPKAISQPILRFGGSPSSSPSSSRFVPPDVGSTFTAAQRGALSDLVELLRLRRATLPIYVELIYPPQGATTQLAHGTAAEASTASSHLALQLADRARELRSRRANALGAPLLAGLRELTRLELGVLEPLLRAMALLPEARLRESLLALAMARQELQKLHRLRSGGGDDRSSLRPSASPFGLSFVSGFVGSNANTLPPQPAAFHEPDLHYFLRTLRARLTDKAALYFQHAMVAFTPDLATREAALSIGAAAFPAGDGAAAGEDEEPPGLVDAGAGNGPPNTLWLHNDFAALLAAFAAKHSSSAGGAALATLMLRPEDLSLHVEPGGGGVVYSRRMDEAPPAGRRGDTNLRDGPHATPPWPTLFLTPNTAATDRVLHSLWPAVYRILGDKTAPLRSRVPVHGAAQLDGLDYTLSMQYMDERVVVLLASPGRRKPSDAPPGAGLLKALAAGISQEKLAEGSLRHKHKASLPWWDQLANQVLGGSAPGGQSLG